MGIFAISPPSLGRGVGGWGFGLRFSFLEGGESMEKEEKEVMKEDNVSAPEEYLEKVESFSHAIYLLNGAWYFDDKLNYFPYIFPNDR